MTYRALFFWAAFLLPSASFGAAAHELPDRPQPFRIIDSHAHFADPDEKDATGAAANMIEEYKAANVVGAVVHASRKEKPTPALKDSAIRYAICAAIIPKRVTVKSVEQGVREGKFHCMKVYLGYVSLWAYDAAYQPFYRLAEKLNVPVVFHTGDTYDKMALVKYADPLSIDEVAVRYPKVKFVVAHMGNPWIQSAAEVVYKNDNVYVDTSALLIGDLAKASSEAVDELITKPLRWFYLYVENPKKFLFGTDWPLVSVKPYAEAVKRAIPQKNWEDVFYNNAVRLFPVLKGAGDEPLSKQPAK